MLYSVFVGRISFDAVNYEEKKMFHIQVSEKRGDTYINIELTKFYDSELPGFFKYLKKGQIVYVQFTPEAKGWLDKETGQLKTRLGGIINKIEIQFPPQIESNPTQPNSNPQ